MRRTETELVAQRGQVIETYNALTDALARFARRLRQHEAGRPAYVAWLPVAELNDDADDAAGGRGYKDRVVPSYRIEPHSLYDADARAYAAQVVEATTYRANQNPAYSWRAPGLIAASPEAIALAGEVNAAKERFYQAVQALSGDRKVRTEQARDALRTRVSLKQAYRLLPILEQRPLAVSFTWAMNVTSSKKATAGQWREHIEAWRGRPLEGYDPVRWEAAIEHASANLAALPANEVIVQSRPVAPHPRVNLWLPDGSTPMRRYSLPMLYADDGDDPPDLQELKVADQRFKRRPRERARTEPEPLSALFALYRYTSAVRTYAASA